MPSGRALWGMENKQVVRDIAAACEARILYLHRTLNSARRNGFCVALLLETSFSHLRFEWGAATSTSRANWVRHYRGTGAVRRCAYHGPMVEGLGAKSVRTPN